MTDSEPPCSQDSIDVRQLANAVRFIAFAIVIGLSYYNFNVVRSITRFETIYSDMLGGKPLPMATQIILSGNVVFVTIASLIPAAALAALLTRRVVAGIYVLGALGLLTLIETGSVFTALLSPIIEITKQMGSGM
jgi:hypothetical protein